MQLKYWKDIWVIKMKLTYLGTAAAEGMPAVFCNCEYCKEARKLGGKNIRTRSQAIINDDLLIDFPADTYSHFLSNNIEGDKIKYLLVTHSHQDHFYMDDLKVRRSVYAHNMRVEKMHIYCGEGTAEKLSKMEVLDSIEIDYTVIKPFEKVVLGEYTIRALPARHYPGDGALFYIIEGEKTILYAHDTGYFYPEVFEYIGENKIVFDLVSLDCTNVDIPINDEGHHMGIDNINRVVGVLKESGAVTDETKVVINHFSHNGAPLYHKLEERVADYGYIVSYDGMSVEV